MKEMAAVFSDIEDELIFWGAFEDAQKAEYAIDIFLSTRPYWNKDEFIIKVLPFGVLL